MDITERKITKIAREAEKLVLLSLREEGVGTAEIDLIHALRHKPGCTQAQLAEMEAYCADYKVFLNEGKTERLSARAAIAAAEAKGFVQYKRPTTGAASFCIPRKRRRV